MSGYNAPREYPFIIELGAGPFFSPAMGRKFSNGFIGIEFYDSDDIAPGGTANLVIPSAGEVVFEAACTDHFEDPNASYGTLPNGTVDATDLAYLRPNWGGGTTHVRVTESVAVIGATHALVKILRT